MKQDKLPCGRTRPKETKVAPDIKQLVQDLEAYCNSQGLRRSSIRRKILEVIVNDCTHFTPQELLARLERKEPEIGRATLYRTLPLLVESGILQEGPNTIEGFPSYELKQEHHDHIVCLDCQAIFEFSNRKIEKEQDNLCEAMSFKAKHHTHVIYAHCLKLD